MSTSELAIFKALADENRLAIVSAIDEGGEVCACELLERLNITQATLSHHMKVLCQAGLIRCRREGRWCHYSIDAEAAHALAVYFEELSISTPRSGSAVSCSRQCQ